MFNKYQKTQAKLEKEHYALSAEHATLFDWCLGLGGESGEVLELVKHHVFGGEPLNKMEFTKELGDVLWYLSALANSQGIDLGDVAALNGAKLAHRYNNMQFSNAESQARHQKEKAFKDTIIYQILQARIEKTTAPMNVIFIGPDGSGKTTIAKQVAEQLGYKYHKCDYKQDDKPNLAKQLLDEQINVVYDRFYYPDDVIYGKLKGEHMDDQAYWKIYDDVLALLEERNTCIIYVTASTDELLKRLETRGDDYIDINKETIENIKSLYGRFISFLDTKRIATTIIDTTDENIDIATCVHHCVTTVQAGQKIFAGIYDDEELPEGPIPSKEDIENDSNN